MGMEGIPGSDVGQISSPMGAGGDQRPAHFQDGFENSRNIEPIGFRPTSVLHSLATSPNGFGQQDAQRRVFNGKNVSLLPTMNGTSAETYQKQTQFNPFRQIGV